MIPIHAPEWCGRNGVGVGEERNDTWYEVYTYARRGEGVEDMGEWKRRIRGSEDRIGEVDRIRLDGFD